MNLSKIRDEILAIDISSLEFKPCLINKAIEECKVNDHIEVMRTKSHDRSYITYRNKINRLSKFCLRLNKYESFTLNLEILLKGRGTYPLGDTVNFSTRLHDSIESAFSELQDEINLYHRGLRNLNNFLK